VSIKEALNRLVLGQDLSQDEARAAMRSLVAGEATPSQIAAFAIALRMKGETPEEIAGLAEVMRDAATRVDAGPDVVDVVGTGGDGSGTFNISTMSALLVASAGGRVAKHGNRSITSACGAADFLEAIGIAIDLNPAGVAQCVDETGFGFMFAPSYHPAMGHSMVPRREIGVRTVFNILGPLTNPAGARRQLTGVAVSGLGLTIAQVLNLMGSQHAVVVHGQDGLDEISVSAPTEVHEARNGDVRSYTIEPEQFGLERWPTEAVRGGTVEANVRLAQGVLEGVRGASREVVLLNGGTALYMAGLAESIAAGVALAAEELDSGRVRAKVAEVAKRSQEIKAEQAAAASSSGSAATVSVTA
jgi:anthranilate phosphoribosyltransferase